MFKKLILAGVIVSQAPKKQHTNKPTNPVHTDDLIVFFRVLLKIIHYLLKDLTKVKLLTKDKLIDKIDYILSLPKTKDYLTFLNKNRPLEQSEIDIYSFIVGGLDTETKKILNEIMKIDSNN